MFDEHELAGLSYRNLQVLAAQHRVPGNIKKHTMIKVILAARKGDDTEVTRLLNELQQTRKKRVKKVKKEQKISLKSTSIRNTKYRENRYYTHQQKSFHCASNLQIAAEEDLSNTVGDPANISNFEDFHEYLVRVQRDYRFNINNTTERIGNPSIVDLRMNEQQTIVHQSSPLDLHRARNILLSSAHNNQNDTDRIPYNLLNSSDVIQAPLLLKKMLQAPAGTNLKDIAGPDSVYRIFSQNNFAINNFVEDSDTLSATSDSNHNGDVDNECTLNTGESSFINIDQNLIDDNGMQQFNALNPNYLNDNDPYRTIYQSNDMQQNFQKFVQMNSTTLSNNNMAERVQDNTEILKTVYYSNQNASQETMNNMQTNQIHHDVNSYPMMSNHVNNNHSNCIESSNSSHCNMYNYQNDSNIVACVNNNMQNNHDNIYYNNQFRSADTNDYYSQPGNAHDPRMFNEIYQDVDAIQSQQYNSSDGPIDNVTELNNSNVINEERCGNNGYYYQHDVHSANSQINYNVNHHDNGKVSANNQYHQHKKHLEVYNVGENQTTNENGDLETYFPHWKQSTITSAAAGMNLENLLNIRKHEANQTNNDETLSVFCYSPPIVTTKQLNDNANVCTQEKSCFVENRGTTLLKTTSSQVYNDTAQGLRMANSMNVLNLDLMDKLELMHNGHHSSGDKNFGLYESDDQLHPPWVIDYSTMNCDDQSKNTE